MIDVALGSNKEFDLTEAQTHGPGGGAAFQYSEPSVTPLSYLDTPY